jgi:hypothetical protein
VLEAADLITSLTEYLENTENLAAGMLWNNTVEFGIEPCLHVTPAHVHKTVFQVVGILVGLLVVGMVMTYFFVKWARRRDVIDITNAAFEATLRKKRAAKEKYQDDEDEDEDEDED